MKNLKIPKIQQKLKENKLDCLIINRTDEFLNEYIPPDAERLYWATNFSGSAGKAIISQNKSTLFVDGRYTFQANEQIDKNVISLSHWNDYSQELNKIFNKNKCIGLDPMLHSIEEVIKIIELAKKNETRLHFTFPNLIDELWQDKPQRQYSIIFDHPVNYAGIDALDKVGQFVKELKNNSLDGYFLSSLDSIAWLLNIRADDILHTPLAFSYLFVSVESKPVLYLSIEKLNDDLRDRLSKFLILKPIEEIEDVFKTEKIEKIVNAIVRKLENSGEGEIRTALIGQYIMDALANLDQVAYVRFASVYKNFREVKDFEDFLGNLEEK